MEREIKIIKLKNEEERNTFYSFRLSTKIFVDDSKEMTLAVKGLYASLVANHFVRDGSEGRESFKMLQIRTHTTKKTLMKFLDVLQQKGYLTYRIDENNRDLFFYQLYEFFM